jgi:anti-sigma-K factor RskA
MYDDDRDALAAEYVLGTLSADEREQAEALLAIDPGFAEIVRVWERRLGELNVMVEAVEPPAEVWDKIKSDIAGPEGAAPEPHFAADEEFSFPPAEEKSPQTVPEIAATSAPEAVAVATPAAEVHEEQEPHEPDAPVPSTADAALEDLLAAPLPEAPPDMDEPSEVLASSLLPPEPEAAAEPAPSKLPELLDEHDFESDLKAVVLEDLAKHDSASQDSASQDSASQDSASQDSASQDSATQDSSGDEADKDFTPGPAPEPFTPLVPPKPERSADVVVLTRRARRWRRMTVAMTAIAALLALYVGVSQFAPGLVPVSRPAPPVVTAQVAPPPSRLVAVLQQDPTTPAFLVSVDPASRMLTVRRVSAAPEPSRSYELWLISNKYPAPRSLGLVGASEFTARALPAGFDADTVKSASYAISLEPAGGSPTGVPTGPILFKGQMVESLPGSAG